MSFKKFLFLFLIILSFILCPKDYSNAQYVRDLTLGMIGNDVIELQNFLEQKGLLVIPYGVSKGYFGDLTKNALSRYQFLNNIYPSLGYFGPKTRSFINSLSITTLSDVDIEKKVDDKIDNLNGTSSTKIIKKTKTINLNIDSQTFESFIADEVGEGDIGTYVIKFEVTAGDEDIYVGGVNYEFSQSLVGFSTTSSFSGPSKRKMSNGNYKVNSNTTEKFTLKVELEADPGKSNTAQRMKLTSILWNIDNSDTNYNLYTSRLDRYETPELFLRGL